MTAVFRLSCLVLCFGGSLRATSAPPHQAATLTILVDGIGAPENRMTHYGRSLGLPPSEFIVFPYDHSGRVSFEQLGADFAFFVAQQHRPVNVVAFSMGGVVVRCALLQKHKLPLERVVFLNSPHHGTWLANLLPKSQPYPGIRELRPDSPLMLRLSQQRWNFPTLAVWCPGDLMILPGSSSRWSQATQEECCWVPAHIWPLHSNYWFSRVRRFLNACP